MLVVYENIALLGGVGLSFGVFFIKTWKSRSSL